MMHDGPATKQPTGNLAQYAVIADGKIVRQIALFSARRGGLGYSPAAAFIL
jgi:hypothetical protein